ncbi:MAG: hypothetical protein IKN65_06685 [Clostridia bacterium]|nr:hypothetical protein [Clostridia bacterium]
MGKVRYVDIPAIVQFIGCVYTNPSLLDNESYSFTLEDFTEEFHQVIFGSIYNLHQLGATEINSLTIEDYLEQRPKKLAVYKANKGAEYLEKVKENCQLAAFNYYYHKVKKMTLLRMYNEKAGMDLSWLYDIDNIFDQKKKQAQEDWLDNHSEEEIADLINDKIEDVRLKYVDAATEDIIQADEGAEELWNELQVTPDIGYPLYGDLINTITRGARLGKFYLRSAATNVGKSRAMVADACNIACDEIYDPVQNKWVPNGTQEPTIYVMTEQIFSEVQTMMWAFLSAVPEDHILTNRYAPGEIERIARAREIIKRSPLYLKELHDFSLKDIENVVKLAVRKYKVRYFFLDYIHSNMKILSEVSSRASVKGLREDNVLFMISVRLKDLATDNGIFIMSSTQLNADYQNASVYDQNLLRGAKAIADKIDMGSIMLRLNDSDIEMIKPLAAERGIEMPNLKISIYKNRRGRYNHILLWCNADLGTCRINPLFATDYGYNIIEMENYKINITPRKESAF